jgi:ribosome-associated translation inhibitor RaiA
MRNELYLKDIRRTEGIENFVNEKVQTLTDKLVQGDSDLHVDVRIAKERQRVGSRKPSYICEVLVKSGMSSKMFKVIRHDNSLMRAVVNSFDALKHVLGKAHDRLRHDRRRLGNNRGSLVRVNASVNSTMASFDNGLGGFVEPGRANARR